MLEKRPLKIHWERINPKWANWYRYLPSIRRGQFTIVHIAIAFTFFAILFAAVRYSDVRGRWAVYWMQKRAEELKDGYVEVASPQGERLVILYRNRHSITKNIYIHGSTDYVGIARFLEAVERFHQLHPVQNLTVIGCQLDPWAGGKLKRLENDGVKVMRLR